MAKFTYSMANEEAILSVKRALNTGSIPIPISKDLGNKLIIKPPFAKVIIEFDNGTILTKSSGLCNRQLFGYINTSIELIDGIKKCSDAES